MAELPSSEARQANNAFALGMISTGMELFLLALLLGGSAFFMQWAFWFIAIGVVIHKLISTGADVYDWGAGKVRSIFASDA